MKKLLILAGLALGSCTPTRVYTVADRATFAAIAPAYRDYVIGDATLDVQQRELRLLSVETWRMRLEAAEVRK